MRANKAQQCAKQLKRNDDGGFRFDWRVYRSCAAQVDVLEFNHRTVPDELASQKYANADAAMIVAGQFDVRRTNLLLQLYFPFFTVVVIIKFFVKLVV